MAFDPEDYLSRILPALINSREAPGPVPQAVLQFMVSDGPELALHYELGAEDGIRVSRGVSDQQDLTLVFLGSDLEAFSQGTLDFSAALSSQRLKVHGDRDLLTWLASHLSH